ncbi:MAG: guanylate kinase [Sodalis sp. (in: enterobacteria)]
MKIQGTLYIISAPSGAGKSSLINTLLKKQRFNDTKISISHTTRAIRPGEMQAQHYFFVSIREFEGMIADDKFLEYAQVFGNYYGTSIDIITPMLDTGIDVFLEIDWQGAQQIRRKMPSVRTIFIFPPSRTELERRLRNRGQDSAKVITRRMSQAVAEMTHFSEYDYLIINDDFNTALLDLKTIILAERMRLKPQQLRHESLIRKLLAD